MRNLFSVVLSAFALTLATGASRAAENSPAGGPGQPLSTPTHTVPVAQPSNVTIQQTSNHLAENSNRQKPEEHGCLPPQRWDPDQKKCVVGIVQNPHTTPMARPLKGKDRPIEEKNGAGGPKPVPVPVPGCGPTMPGRPDTSTC